MPSARLQQLLKFLESSPDDAFLLFAMAKEYEKGGDDENAMTYYQRLYESSPEYVGLYYHLGKLYERQEKPVEAFKTYTEGMGVAKQQGDQHALNELAGARLILGDEDDFL